jgi:predicted amidohydrolase
MKIALVSLDQVWENKDLNWRNCKNYINQASKAKADLVIFPEMTLTGFSSSFEKNSENRSDSDTLDRFQENAKINNIAIIFGMLIKEDGYFYNKSFFVSCEGDVVGEYSKIHTFSFAGENKYIKSGDKLAVVAYQDMHIGMSICYDLRFPELYSALGNYSNLIVNIANWPVERIKHWTILLKARAIENQVYMAGINRIGVDGNQLEYIESSLMYDENGDPIEGESIDKNMKIYKISRRKCKERKKLLLTTRDRRVEFYKDIL